MKSGKVLINILIIAFLLWLFIGKAEALIDPNSNDYFIIKAEMNIEMLDGLYESKYIDAGLECSFRYNDIGGEVINSLYRKKTDNILVDHKKSFEAQFNYYLDPYFLYLNAGDYRDISFDTDEIDIGIGAGYLHKNFKAKTGLYVRDTKTDQEIFSKTVLDGSLRVNDFIKLRGLGNYNVNINDFDDYTAMGDIWIPFQFHKNLSFKIGYQVNYDNITNTDINTTERTYSKMVLEI